jgi:membrane protein implicated in regulation of membrane protease activity
MKPIIRDALLLILTFEGFFALAFGGIFIAALVAVIGGAWWHVVTMFFSGLILSVMIRELLVRFKNNSSNHKNKRTWRSN